MKYKLQMDEESRIAKAQLINVPISFKKGVELTRYLKNKSLDEAYNILEGVISKKKPIPYRKYNQAKAHQSNIGPGGYPVKAAKFILKLLKSAEANAADKGLFKENLYIYSLTVDKGTTRFKYGRKRGRQGKSTHVQVILIEKENSKKNKQVTTKQSKTKQESKQTTKQTKDQNQSKQEQKNQDTNYDNQTTKTKKNTIKEKGETA